MNQSYFFGLLILHLPSPLAAVFLLNTTRIFQCFLVLGQHLAVCVCVHAWTCSGRTKVSDLLEMGLQGFATSLKWILVIELWPSGLTLSGPNHSSTSPVSGLQIFIRQPCSPTQTHYIGMKILYTQSYYTSQTFFFSPFNMLIPFARFFLQFQPKKSCTFPTVSFSVSF